MTSSRRCTARLEHFSRSAIRHYSRAPGSGPFICSRLVSFYADSAYAKRIKICCQMEDTMTANSTVGPETLRASFHRPTQVRSLEFAVSPCVCENGFADLAPAHR